MAKIRFCVAALGLILLLSLLLVPINPVAATPDEVKWSRVNIPAGISSIIDLAVSPNYSQDNTLFMLTWGGEHSLWRSLNGGTAWEKIFTSALANVDDIKLVELSPQYGNGSQVVFIAGTSSGNPAIWKSIDSGQTFSPAKPTPFLVNTWVWAVVNDTTLFVGGDDGNHGLIYYTTDSGLSYSTPAVTDNQTIKSIVLSPSYDLDRTILVGNTNGWVYWSNDNGTSFKPVPSDATSPPLTGSITVAFDPQYSSNNTIYAASSTADKGIYRFIIGSSVSWESINSPAGGMIGQLMVSADGTLYASNFKADGGMERCLNPTFHLAPTFETVTGGLDDGATLSGLWLYGNQLWSIDTTNTKVMTYTDSLAVPVTLTSPSNKAPGIGTIINYKITDVTIDWEVLTGATSYRWQLDYDRDFSTVPAGFEDKTAASSARLPALEPATKYYWQVRAIEPVLSRWSPKWSFNTSIGAPTLYSPEAGASGVGLKPLFQWSSIAWATSYELLISADASFSSPLISMTGGKALPTTAWLCDTELDYNTTYYWKVRALGSDTYSPWSNTGIFTTIPEPTTPPPEPPLLHAPLPGASNVCLTPLFAWSGADWATKYEFILATDNKFADVAITKTGNNALPATAWLCDTELDYNTTYYWKVRALSSDTYSPWSDTSIFTTIPEPTTPPPEPPLLHAPLPGASDICLTPLFAWSGADWATKYEFILATDNKFADVVITKTGNNALPATAWQCNIELDYNTTYYWKVRALSSDTYSPWSDTGIFITIPEPTTPPPEPLLLHAPSPGASDICLTPLFAWSGADWATKYEFILATDSKFADVVITKTGNNALPATAWLCDTELDYNTTYYWKVRALSSDTYSPWSDTGIFTTIPEPTTPLPEPPLLHAPLPGASDICLTPLFAWSGADWATKYEFILATDSKFAHVVITKTGRRALPTTAWLCDTELDYNTTYYWKVRALSSDTYSPWSDTGIFTTIPEPTTPPPEPPLLHAPLPGASNVCLTPLFAWKGDEKASKYEFILATDNKFADMVVTKTGRRALPTTAWQCTKKLNYNTTYYWKVRATSSDTYNPWSDTGIFITIPEPATIPPPPPPPPSLHAPSPGASNVCLTPSFAWKGDEKTSKYEFILARDNKFADMIITKTGNKALPATAWLCDTKLDYNTTYYWKVRTISSDTYSPWSNTGIFTTTPEPTSPPPEPTTPDWVKWLMYLAGGLLLTMVAMLITMIILGVKITKP